MSSVSQIELISAITLNLDEQGQKTLSTRQMNAVIEAANIVIRAVQTEDVMSRAGMTIGEWLLSDDTGMSSCFLASRLCGFSRPYAHPYDPADFGRCVRLLDSVDGLRKDFACIADASREWARLVERWGEMEALYRVAWDKWQNQSISTCDESKQLYAMIQECLKVPQ